MERADQGLAFMLQYENIAWYDSGEVRILDRRVYPTKTEFVRCKTHGEVAQAIADMVTQSAGPYTAAAMGMHWRHTSAKRFPKTRSSNIWRTLRIRYHTRARPRLREWSS